MLLVLGWSVAFLALTQDSGHEPHTLLSVSTEEDPKSYWGESATHCFFFFNRAKENGHPLLLLLLLLLLFLLLLLLFIFIFYF
jgi:hypothetical protein